MNTKALLTKGDLNGRWKLGGLRQISQPRLVRNDKWVLLLFACWLIKKRKIVCHFEWSEKSAQGYKRIASYRLRKNTNHEQYIIIPV